MTPPRIEKSTMEKTAPPVSALIAREDDISNGLAGSWVGAFDNSSAGIVWASEYSWVGVGVFSVRLMYQAVAGGLVG